MTYLEMEKEMKQDRARVVVDNFYKMMFPRLTPTPPPGVYEIQDNVWRPVTEKEKNDEKT